MKKIYFVLIFCLVANNVFAVSPVLINTCISRDASNFGVWLNISYENKTKDMQCLDTAFFGLDEDGSAETFEVYRGGISVGYSGAVVSKLPDSASLLYMMPGQKINVKFQLSSNFDFSKIGLYSIKQKTMGVSICGPNRISYKVESNELKIGVGLKER